VQTEIETTATNQYFMSRSMNNRSRYNICKQDGEDHYITLDTDLEFDYAVAAVDGNDDPIASKWVKLRLKDKTSGAVLFSFEGSLDPAAVDEFNQSTYLPNVVSGQTDLVEVEVSVLGLAGVPITCAFYGKDGQGAEKWVSDDLVYFTEGSTTYASTDYDASCTELQNTEHGYGYILGGNKGVDAYVSKLIELGIAINKCVVWDIDGDTASAAITAYDAVNVDSHYSHVYWAPLLRNDPLNGGKARIGVSGIQVGMRCSRNARTDANGIAPKNYPIAGKDWPITATGIVQYSTPSDTELDDLAEAHINPVIFERYNAGAKYVFTDSLTGAKTNGDKKLIAVAEMSSTVDHYIASFGKECLQLPMLEGIKRFSDFVKKDMNKVKEWYRTVANSDFVEKNLDGGKKTIDEAIKEMSGWMVRNTMPTYSKSPEIVQALKNVPLGTFISFQAEMLRTGFNTISISMREIASKDPVLRSMGLRSLFGMYTVFGGLGYGAKKLYNNLTGFTDEQLVFVIRCMD